MTEELTMEQNEMVEHRTIETITAEIVMIKRGAEQIALYIAVELGRRLTEAKQLLDHGQWGKWLAESVNFSQDTAGRYMKLFKEYADGQTSLFGAEVKSATLRNLSVSKALALLAVPADEREEFVRENDVESLSTRQTEELMERLKQAEQARTDAEIKSQGLALDLEVKRLEAERAALERDGLAERVKELENRPAEVAVQEPDPEEMRRAVDDAVQKATEQMKAEAKDLRAKLREAKVKAKALEAEAAGNRQAVDEAKAKAADQAEQAEERERMRIRIRELEKQVAMSNEAVHSFNIRFQEAQRLLNAALAGVDDMTDGEAKGKCRAAMVKLLESFLERFQEEAGK